jgi:hypothetical protein
MVLNSYLIGKIISRAERCIIDKKY